MKTHEQRYNDAIARNLNSAETYNRCRYVGLTLVIAKKRIGIKLGDTAYDERIKKIIEEAR